MHKRFSAAIVLLALAVAACSSGGSTPTMPTTQSLNSGAKKPSATHIAIPKHTRSKTRATLAAGTNVLADPGFESGGFSSWYQCGNVNATITSARAHSGTYSDLNGSSAKPEVSGYAGVCQDVTVPSNGQLSFWVYEGTNDTVAYADQEADLLDAYGNVITTLYSEASTTTGWVQKSFNVSAYAGQSVSLFFGVYGNGWSSGYIYQYVDDVSLTNGTVTPSPSPTPTIAPSATPSPTPTPKPTATPTVGPTPTPTPTPKPTATPTVAPTPTPTVAPTPTPTPAYPCNNQQFLTYQSEFASGSISGDQFVQVCGKVTQVLPEKTTTSGRHGYFYVAMPSGYQIEIVSNLDAMAQAPTNDPPTTWPWVAVGNYTYVQGRYYYDNSTSQGIDWTEDDTSSSWPHTGDVVVCDSNGNNCNFYW